MAIGRHWTVRSVGAMSPYVGLGTLSVGCVPCIGCLGRLTHSGLLSHTVHLDHASRLCMHQSHTLVTVHVGLLTARKDHSLEAVAR